MDASATVMATVSVPLNEPSLAVSVSVYAPAAENVAVVDAADESAKVTLAGPVALHVYVSVLFSASVALPVRVAAAGN